MRTFGILFLALLVASGCGSPPKPERPSDTGRRLSAEGALAYDSGHPRDAVKLYHDALKEYQRVDDAAGAARVSNNLATVLVLEGRPQDAEVFALKAVAAYDQLGDKAALAHSMLNLGAILLRQDKHDDARTAFASALAYYDREKHPLPHARALLGMAFVDCAAGKAEEAEKGAADAGELFKEHKDAAGTAGYLIVAGRIAKAKGDIEGAKALVGKALELDRERGASYDVLNDLEELGNICAGAEHDAARDYYTRALAAAKSLGLTSVVKRLEAKLTPAAEK